MTVSVCVCVCVDEQKYTPALMKSMSECEKPQQNRATSQSKPMVHLYVNNHFLTSITEADVRQNRGGLADLHEHTHTHTHTPTQLHTFALGCRSEK